jgi:hypothetical protein
MSYETEKMRPKVRKMRDNQGDPKRSKNAKRATMALKRARRTKHASR